MWISPELHDEEPTVINFNHDCRHWPPGAANYAFSQLLSDISSGTESILVATDDSFDLATNRARWGFAIFSNGEFIQQGAGTHQVFTSSTRMELEAVRNALKAVKDMKAPPTIIVAMDSVAILCKIQSGYPPGEWFDFRDAHPTTKVIWVFVPGHSGVTCNETPDMLAWSCSNFTPLDLFPSNLKLMGTKFMERSAYHIHPILGRMPPHLPWYLTWIITLQHLYRTCQSNLQPTAHWQHLLLHSLMGLGEYANSKRISAAAHPQQALFAKAKSVFTC